MKRRSFLALLGFAPAAVVVALEPVPSVAAAPAPEPSMGPLEFVDGDLRLSVAQIGTCSGSFQSQSGRVRVDAAGLMLFG